MPIIAHVLKKRYDLDLFSFHIAAERHLCLFNFTWLCFFHRWSLRIRDKLSGQESEEVFDAVLVCTGHHGSVHWPKFPGADEFQVRQI